MRATLISIAWRHRTHGLALAAVMVAPGLGGVLGAQDTARTGITVVRAVTPFEVQVERLSRLLLERQRRAISLANTRQRLLRDLQTDTIADEQRVVTVNSLRMLESSLTAIEADRANIRRVLTELCAKRTQPDGWLGVNFSSDWNVSVSPDGIGLHHFKTYPSIESVEPNSPAERAGIQRGDVLLTLAGRDMSDAEVVLGELLKPGARLPLRLRRGVESKSVVVVIERRPEDFQVPCAWVDETLSAATAPMGGGTIYRVPAPGSAARVVVGGSRRPAGSGAVAAVPRSDGGGSFMYFATSGTAYWAAGAHIVPLNSGLAKLTSVERGVFVVEVTRRSPAAQSGLVSGDVIVSVGGRRVTSLSVLRQLMEQSETKELTLEIVRERKPETVVLKW